MTSHQRKVVIVAFGASVAEATRQPKGKKWLDVLASLLAEDFPNIEFAAVNSGKSGETSREGLARIDEHVLAHKPDYVVLEYGGNDACHDEARHVPLGEYRRNLDTIKHCITEACGGRLVLTTVVPIVNKWHARRDVPMYIEAGGLDAYVNPYRDVTREFATQNDCLLVDIDFGLKALSQRDGAEVYTLPDGVHLTEAGNRAFAEMVLDVLSADLRAGTDH